MSVKQQVLQLLQQQKGQYLSGEQLATTIGVTRAAVWKAIRSLRQAGYLIDAVTNKGYALSEKTDLLSTELVASLLPKNSMFAVTVQDKVTSTNEVLRGQVDQPEGFVLVANRQTAGMGRCGRPFFSPPDTGLYFSLLLKPSFSPTDAIFLTTAAAVAVCQAIESLTDRHPTIKWVNDVFVGEHKVCGILTNASMNLETQQLDYAMVGIGLNAYLPVSGFPAELADGAGAVWDRRQADGRATLLATILTRFEALYRQMDGASIATLYRGYSNVIGKRVAVTEGNRTYNATVKDIDDRCRLLLTTDDGQVRTLQSGEIRIRNLLR